MMSRIEQTDYNPFFIITGGPGAGKTTLLEALAKRNFKCIPEVARQIIKEQVETEGEALPWKNKELFANLMLARSVERYHATPCDKKEIIFLIVVYQMIFPMPG